MKNLLRRFLEMFGEVTHYECFETMEEFEEGIKRVCKDSDEAKQIVLHERAHHEKAIELNHPPTRYEIELTRRPSLKNLLGMDLKVELDGDRIFFGGSYSLDVKGESYSVFLDEPIHPKIRAAISSAPEDSSDSDKFYSSLPGKAIQSIRYYSSKIRRPKEDR